MSKSTETDADALVYVLYMNDMRFSKIEVREAVARASSESLLRDFMHNESVETYTDAQDARRIWSKSFKEGGPLEWCNPCDFRIQCMGTLAQKLDSIRNEWQRMIDSVPEVEL